jgi:hypothetical protein
MKVKRVVRNRLTSTRDEVHYKTHLNPHVSFYRNKAIRLTGSRRGYLSRGVYTYLDHGYHGMDYHLRFVVLATNDEYANNPTYRDEVWYVTFHALD